MEVKKNNAGRKAIGECVKVILPPDILKWLRRKPTGESLSKKIRDIVTVDYQKNMAHAVEIPKCSGTFLTVTGIDLGNHSITVELPENLRAALCIKSETLNINLAGQ